MSKGLWVKLSVDYLDDPKICEVGVVGEDLFIRGLAYAKKQDSPLIAFAAIPRLGFGIVDPMLVADRLCDAGLWALDGNSYRIVAWDEWQTSESGKSLGGTLGNHRRWHRDKQVAGCPHCEGGEGERAVSEVAVTAPASDVPAVPEEVKHLCTLLAELMVRNGCKRPTVTNKWWKDMHAINRLDGHSFDLIERVLRWSQDDPFWRTNILSPGKFRTQFDRLNMKATGGMPFTVVQKKPIWVADPDCQICGGDGFESVEDENGTAAFGPCPCRRAPE